MKFTKYIFPVILVLHLSVFCFAVDRATEDAYRANNLGVALLEQYKPDEAVTEFKKALQLRPDFPMAQTNLAIGLYNSQRLADARAACLNVLKIDPNSLQANYIIGLIGRTENNPDESLAAFRAVLKSDPNDVGANVNVGQVLLQRREYDEALKHFRTAYNAEPYNTTVVYNLATTLQRKGEREEAAKLLKTFQTLRDNGAGTSIGLNYLEQGRYAEAIASTGAESELVDKANPRVFFQDATARLPLQKSFAYRKPIRYFNEISLKPQTKYDILRNYGGGSVLFDFDADGDLDLAKVTNSIANIKGNRSTSTADVRSSVFLYRNDNGKFVDISLKSGDLSRISDVIGTGIVSGDIDNDGLPDLLVVGYGKLKLLRNEGKGRFIDITTSAKLPDYANLSVSCALVDVDHDGDLDIFIAGFTVIDSRAEVNDFVYPAEFSPAQNLLLRNNGDKTFADISESAGINKGKENFGAKSIAIVPTDYDNRRDVDLLVLNYDGKPNLFRNLRDGSLKDVATDVGLDIKGKWTCVAVGDFNKDTFVDFFFGLEGELYKTDGNPGVLAISDGRGKFTIKEAPKGTANATSAQFMDYDNDGLLDLIVNTNKGLVLSRNLGDGWTEANQSAFKTKQNSIAGSRNLLSGDIDNDGDLDLLTYTKNGTLQFLRNSGGNTNRSEVLRLQGRVSNKTAIGAKLDMRSGSLSQKLETYSASPAPAPSQAIFGLGKREKPDAVRIIWTSGIIQSEIDFPKPGNQTAKTVTPFKIEELDRKPSSCPYLYTWNGEKFEFITDFLGGGEMGNWKAQGVYHYPDPDEYVRIPGDKLKAKNGRYEIRVTNELEEVMYLDRLQLVTVEHDADTEVYPNEGLGIPTAGQTILYTTKNAKAPLTATDNDGRDVLPKVKELDRVFYDSFTIDKIRGYSDEHTLTLKLDDKTGYNGRTLLLLTGWTDYAFSSDNLAASQSGRSLFLPYLQVKNEKGEWQTVYERIGISVGRPQTVVVDLTDKFLSADREVRIVTNFRTYWDKIEVDTSEDRKEDLKQTRIEPAVANLKERGFSKEVITNQMISADYNSVIEKPIWKFITGSFTRSGDVRELLNEVDDNFVISKAGDEFVLSFPALPDPPKGREYTFLLYASGYSKEMDINSGSPDVVFPLPFKKMSKYPYDPREENYPMTDERREMFERYNTRRVVKPLPAIELETAR